MGGGVPGYQQCHEILQDVVGKHGPDGGGNNVYGEVTSSRGIHRCRQLSGGRVKPARISMKVSPGQ